MAAVAKELDLPVADEGMALLAGEAGCTVFIVLGAVGAPASVCGLMARHEVPERTNTDGEKVGRS